MTNAFEITMPPVEGWQELRDWLISLGFKKVEVPLFNVEVPLFNIEAKALVPRKEPATLKFYQNYKC